MNMNASRMQVVPKRPIYYIGLFLIACFSACAALWVVLEHRYQARVSQFSDQSFALQALLETKEALQAEGAALSHSEQEMKKRIAVLERGHQVDQATMMALRQEAQALDGEIHELRREVEFYEGMMDVAGASSGLRIQGILVESTDMERHYRYKLVLTHTAKNDSFVEGVMEIAVEGIQEGVQKALDLSDIHLGKAPELAFKFKNFKQFKGGFILPKAFAPANMQVRARFKGKSTVLERDFSWPNFEGRI